MTAVPIVPTSVLLSRPARFRFVSWIRDGRRLIMDQHASVVPAPSP